MTDAEWIKKEVPKANTPEKALRLILDHINFFGDHYYAGLTRAMVVQAEKVLGKRR